MDYTIKSGDTLSAIAKANNTTVEALSKANSIADPNKINAGAILKLPETTMVGADINASSIKSGVPEITPATVPTPSTTGANAITKWSETEQKRIADERAAAEKALGATSETTTAEKIISKAKERPTIDTFTKLKEEMETSGATQLQKDISTQSANTAAIQEELDKLDLQEQTEIDALETNAITRGAIDREKAVINRKYASQKALKKADYSIEAAKLAVLQGNYTMAKSAAQDAVDAYTNDYQQNVKTFDIIFSVYSDALKDLDEDEQNVLKTAAKNAQDELDKVTKEKTEVSNLMLEYPNAGINIGDNIDTATKKATQYQIDNPKVNTQIVGSAESGYQLVDSDTGKIIKTISSGNNTPTNIFSEVSQVEIDDGLISEINDGADALQAATLYINGTQQSYTEKEKTAILNRAKEIKKSIDDAKNSKVVQDPNNPYASILKGYNPFIAGLSNELFK